MIQVAIVKVIFSIRLLMFAMISFPELTEIYN